MAGYDYVDFIHSKHAGRPGRDSPGRDRGLKSVALLRPSSDVRKRRIAPAKFAIRAKLNNPSAFADRCFKPDGIFALSDQLSLLRLVDRRGEATPRRGCGRSFSV